MSKNTKDPFSELKFFFLKWVSMGFKKNREVLRWSQIWGNISEKVILKTVLQKKSQAPRKYFFSNLFRMHVYEVVFISEIRVKVLTFYTEILTFFQETISVLKRGFLNYFDKKIENLRTKTGKNTYYSDLGIPIPIHKHMNEMNFLLKRLKSLRPIQISHDSW